MEQRLIDANALLETMKHSGRPAYMLVQEAPTIEYRPVVHGRWEKQRGIYSCSVCGKTCPYYINADVIEYWPCNFCPNCGAKMDGGEENA